MPAPLVQPFGTFSRGKTTQTQGTVITVGIPPYGGNQLGPGTGIKSKGFTHITSLMYDVGTTSHTLTVMRPLNYTTFTADAAAAQAVVNIAADPGTWQTANVYKYPLPNGVTAPSQANNTIAGSDYVAYQTATGLWVFDTVSSVSTLAITLTTNLPTGGVKSGGLFYFFGVTTDTNPANGLAHQQIDTLAAGSGTERRSWTDPSGLWHSLAAGDPMILHSSNGTTAGVFQLITGYYLNH